MRHLAARVFLVLAFLASSSCTIYTEKQSEALSRAVYGTRDSFDAGRLELADSYSGESARLVKPPKKRIEIKPIYQEKSSKQVGGTTTTSKQRVVIIPEKYRNDSVVVVSSAEYEELAKDKKVAEQLKLDNANLAQTKAEVDKELVKQAEYNNKMIKDLNSMQRQLVEKDLAILQRNIAIVVLVGLIAAGVYLRMKGIL